MSLIRVKQFRVVAMALIAICLLFFVWSLWQFPAYARELPQRILPNSAWTTADAQEALASLGWSVETFVGWRLGFVLITAVFYMGLGIFVFVRARDDWFASLFALSLVLFGIGTADLPFVLAQWGAWGDRLAYGIAAVSFGVPMFLILLFPDGRFVPRGMRWVGLIGVLFILYAGFLQPHPTRPPAPYLSVISSVLFAAGVLSQVYRYRAVSTAEQRQQTKWVLWAILLIMAYKVVLTLIYFNPVVNAINGQGLWYSFLRTATLTLVTATAPIALTFAILRYRLWDIDLIIRKTLLYGIMIVCVIGLYVLVVGYLGALLQTERNHIGLSLVATGLVAVLFTPLKNGVERQINRFFFGQRDEPYQLVTQLGRQLETAVDPASALDLTVQTVGQALKLPYVAIVLQRGEGLVETAVFGTPQPQIGRFPLVYTGEPIGELIAGWRDAHEPFTPADQRLLTELARQIGAAANAVLLTANLEQARLRLVTERGEARRQLGSDLHDGVGHQLVGLSRQLERTMTLLPNDPDQAAAELATINQQLVALTQQVRKLAHQLYPPELELLGLVGALREHAATETQLRIVLDVPYTLPPLPAEIETAVYYITLEALTNIAKHAAAQTCRIHLQLVTAPHTAVLQLEINDDGRGLPPDARGGLGLLSMQARAAEVGGSCVVTNGVDRGTAVSVRIPCPIKDW